VITTPQYFGAKPHTAEQTEVARDLLDRVDALRSEFALVTGVKLALDPDTGSEISGSKGGSGDGGFRLTTATTGRTGSPHKDAKGVDCYDPDNAFDTWLDTFETGDGGNTKLAERGLYRERPEHTPGWCHLQTRPPGSGRRTFTP
jgi:hypothetical protein